MSDEIVEKNRRVRFLRVCSENLYTNDYFLFSISTLTAAKKREVFKYRFFSLNILPASYSLHILHEFREYYLFHFMYEY